jgi:hypothetical protein
MAEVKPTRVVLSIHALNMAPGEVEARQQQETHSVNASPYNPVASSPKAHKPPTAQPSHSYHAVPVLTASSATNAPSSSGIGNIFTASRSL